MPDIVPGSMFGIAECMCINIIRKLNLLVLRTLHKAFATLKWGGYEGREKDIESPLSPFVKRLLHSVAGMGACIVKDNEYGFSDCRGEAVNELHHILCVYTLATSESMV